MGLPVVVAMSPLAKFESLYVKPKEGRTLIIGSKVYAGRVDRRSLHKDAVGLDMAAGEGVDVVWNLEEKPPADLGQFDHIECLSVLEHCKRPWLLAENVENLFVEGGTLFVAAPFVHEFHGYPNDHFRFTTQGLKLMFPNLTFEALGLAHKKLAMQDRLGRIKLDGFPYFPRCEAVGFARK